MHTHKKRDSTHTKEERNAQACKGIHYYNTGIHTSRETHKEKSTEAQHTQAGEARTERGTTHASTERGTHRERHNTHTHTTARHTQRDAQHTHTQQ